MKSVVGAGVVVVLATLSASPLCAKGKTSKIPIWDSARECRNAYAASPVMLNECIDGEQVYHDLTESYWSDTPETAIQTCLDRAELEKMEPFPVQYYTRLGQC